MSTPDELKKLFKEAADIAEQVPEGLRQVAFQRALDALLGPTTPQQSRSAADAPHQRKQVEASHQTKSGSPTRSGAVTQLLEAMNRTELADLMAGRKTLDRALLVLKAAQNHGITELSAPDIAQILTQKFREATTPQAVRMALDRSPSFTDRRPSGGTFQYSIMAPGERYLESAPSKPPTGRKPKPRKEKAAAAKSHSTPTTGEKSSSVKAGKTGRPGPKQMLEVLVREGFFGEPRTMGQILSYLEEKKTHRYATSDFTATLQRMVRQSKLERTRNSQGQYEYKTPSVLALAFAGIEEPFRSRTIEKYLSLREAFVGGAYDATGLRGGVFAEVILRMLQQTLTGAHIPFGTPIANFEDECAKLQRLPKTSGHESLRIVLPRALSFLYTIRNKRGIGHAGGDVEANKIDAATCVRVADWICCELIRLNHGVSLEEAQAIVDTLSVRELPSVWMVGGKSRVLNTSLDYRSQALVLLYSHSEQVVLVEDLREWIEYPERARFTQRILEPLHRDRLVEWDRDNEAVTLSPKGAKHVEERILGQGGPK